MYRGSSLLAAALLVLVFAPAQADESGGRLRLGEPQLRVFYRDSGRLSDDLLHGEGPSATWNLTIGGGELDEPADDAAIILPILAAKDASGDGQVFSDVPISIRVRDGAGRSLGHRTVKGILTSGEGRAHLALWLTDLTCAGPIVIEGTLGRQRVEARYAFNCGE